MLKLFKLNKMFRILLGYQFFSAIGGAMFSMFILLSIHLIYGNPIYTGIAGFLMAAPRIASFAVGPIIDRRNKVAIMRLTTFLEFLVLGLLAFTPLVDQLGVMFMFAVIFIYNIAALFENPASTAYLPQIVDEDGILQANSLINIVAMAGGVVIAAVLFTSLAGEINFQFLYGFSAVFIAFAFLFSLLLKNIGGKKEDAATHNYLQDLKNGASFIRKNVLLFVIIAVVAISFGGEIAFINRPMFLEYHVGAQNYILFVVMGLVGGIAASSLVSSLGSKFKIGSLIFILILLAGVIRIVFALVVPVQMIAGLATAAAYAAVGTSVGIIFQSLIQKIPEKDMVGRIDTMATTFVAIAATIGALVGGFLGSAVSNIAYIYIWQGIGYAILGLLLIFVPSIRKLPKMKEIGTKE